MLVESLITNLNKKHSCRVTEAAPDVVDAFKAPCVAGQRARVAQRARTRRDHCRRRSHHDRSICRTISARLPAPDPPRRSRAGYRPLTCRHYCRGEAEKALIQLTLRHTKNNKTRAAEILGISFKTLFNKLKEYGASSAGEQAAEA
jgi:transcriptional regulator of acetoin/glycerol metabolism